MGVKGPKKILNLNVSHPKTMPLAASEKRNYYELSQNSKLVELSGNELRTFLPSLELEL